MDLNTINTKDDLLQHVQKMPMDTLQGLSDFNFVAPIILKDRKQIESRVKFAAETTATAS